MMISGMISGVSNPLLRGVTAMNDRPRIGLTLVEVLVVIAIIGVLVALIVAGVMVARRTADRNRCATNLRQVGLALHGHEATHGVLLDLRRCDTHPGSLEPTYWVHLMPFLERRDLHDAAPRCDDFDAWSKFVQLAERGEPVLRCPAATGPVGRSDYRFCAGDTISTFISGSGSSGSVPLCRGIFYEHRGIPVDGRNVTDGRSQTVAVSETLGGDGAGAFQSRTDVWQILGLATWDSERLRRLCEVPPATPMSFLGDGAAYGGGKQIPGMCSITTSWFPTAAGSDCQLTDQRGIWRARSAHGGGGRHRPTRRVGPLRRRRDRPGGLAGLGKQGRR